MGNMDDLIKNGRLWARKKALKFMVMHNIAPSLAYREMKKQLQEEKTARQVLTGKTENK